MLFIQPKSVGTIRLKSQNPFDYPLINPNLLNKNKDLDTMFKGIQQIFSIANTTAFKKINLEYASPPLPACRHLEFKSKAYWYCFLRQLSTTGYHPMGSCAMGTNPKKGAVVDSKLNVHGIKNLRVGDASVFATVIAGYPSMNCLMIGEKVSDEIKAKYL